MKPILVTGGAKGLGAEICRTLAAQKHPIVIHYKESREEAYAVQQECLKKTEASIIQGDFSTPERVEDFIGRYKNTFSQTKGIVNNVGQYLIKNIAATEMEEWHRLFQINYFAPIQITQALISDLLLHQGSVVNIGLSGLSTHRGFTEMGAFAATKSALYFYTRSLAKELAKESVRVNMVSPGYMENSIELKRSLLPTGKAISLKEVALVVTSLFDPSYSSITGQNIEVAAGVNL